MTILTPESCFSEIGKLDCEVKQLFELSRLEDPTQWFSHLDFDVMLLENNLIEKVPLLVQVSSVAAVDRVAILSMPAMSTYDWHIDDHRNATVNLLINNHDTSQCFFGRRIDGNKHSLIELSYKPNTFYLFNTKSEHMVINRGPRRFILSLQFRSKLEYSTIQERLQRIIQRECSRMSSYVRGSHS